MSLSPRSRIQVVVVAFVVANFKNQEASIDAEYIIGRAQIMYTTVLNIRRAPGPVVRVNCRGPVKTIFDIVRARMARTHLESNMETPFIRAHTLSFNIAIL